MLTMRIENAIRTLVEAMLPRFSGTLGLEVTLDLRWSRYSEDGEHDKNFRKEVRLLFMRESNYTKVFARVSDFGNRQKTDQWKLIGDHDSEWMSGVENLFRNLEREAWEWDREESPGQTTGPSEHFGFSIFSEPTFREGVKYELLPGQDRYGGEYTVILGGTLTRRQAAQKMRE